MRYVIGLSFAALAVWALQATGLLMAFTMFILLGTIPGTHVNIPPTYMLVLLGALMAATVYWLFRQRPAQQIQDMKRAYHEQVDETPAVKPAAKAKRESLFLAGIRQSYTQTRRSTQRSKNRVFAKIRRSLGNAGTMLEKTSRPIRLFILAVGAIVLIASHEIVAWIRPHAKRLAAWLRKQAGYSLKGTMLSAHKWSSLSKKALSSLTSLLKRASSVLKRGKSLWIRSAR